MARRSDVWQWLALAKAITEAMRAAIERLRYDVTAWRDVMGTLGELGARVPPQPAAALRLERSRYRQGSGRCQEASRALLRGSEERLRASRRRIYEAHRRSPEA